MKRRSSGVPAPRAILLAFLALAFLVFPLLCPARSDAAGESLQVTGLGVVTDDTGVVVTIQCSEMLRAGDYGEFLIEGSNLAVDIFGASNAAWPMTRTVDSPYLVSVKIGERFEPRKAVRVVFEVGKPAPYKIVSTGSLIVVTFGRPGQKEPPAAAEPALPLLTAMVFRPVPNKSRVEFIATAPPEYALERSEDPAVIGLRLKKLRLASGVQSPLDLAALERELLSVSLKEEIHQGAPSVLVTALLREAVPYKVTREGDSLILDVDRLAADSTPAPRPPLTAAPGGPSAGKVVHGKHISLDFIDADVNDMLRLISDVSGANFAAGDEVKGKVSVRLLDVPWEVALDTILMTNTPRLTQVSLSDNIIRITTEDNLLKEEEQRQKKKELERRNLQAEMDLQEKEREKSIALEPIVSREFSISYAQIAEGQKGLMTILENLRSDRNELLMADPRTNTIIVRDQKSTIDEMARLVGRLDTPTPAVVVEARIVEVSDSAAESLGVRWNSRYSADPAHGNALPFAFPNSMGVEGQVRGEDGAGNFMVNLPASNPTAAVGITFGHIANTFSLDMQLSAMENMGETKILSNPKIVVIQNETATINIGEKLPIPRTDAEGNRTVEFLDTGIILKVTPQVTNDGRVFMDLRVEKSSRGDTVATTEGPMYSINSRNADTKVLVADGETSVIGGLFTEENIDSRANIPGFAELPLLGWLFRNKDVSQKRSELMIFLTPRIVASR